VWRTRRHHGRGPAPTAKGVLAPGRRPCCTVGPEGVTPSISQARPVPARDTMRPRRKESDQVTAEFTPTHPMAGGPLRPEFGRTAADHAEHRAGFPEELVRRTTPWRWWPRPIRSR
jgi:hypothetical protein